MFMFVAILNQSQARVDKVTWLMLIMWCVFFTAVLEEK
jgi:hypothetical protein